jgi:hypothetical protein
MLNKKLPGASIIHPHHRMNTLSAGRGPPSIISMQPAVDTRRQVFKRVGQLAFRYEAPVTGLRAFDAGNTVIRLSKGR